MQIRCIGLQGYLLLWLSSSFSDPLRCAIHFHSSLWGSLRHYLDRLNTQIKKTKIKISTNRKRIRSSRKPSGPFYSSRRSMNSEEILTKKNKHSGLHGLPSTFRSQLCNLRVAFGAMAKSKTRLEPNDRLMPIEFCKPLTRPGIKFIGWAREREREIDRETKWERGS